MWLVVTIILKFIINLRFPSDGYIEPKNKLQLFETFRLTSSSYDVLNSRRFFLDSIYKYIYISVTSTVGHGTRWRRPKTIHSESGSVESLTFLDPDIPRC